MSWLRLGQGASMLPSEFRDKVLAIVDSLSEEEISREGMTIVFTDGISRHTASWGSLEVGESGVSYVESHCVESSAPIVVSYSVIEDIVCSVSTVVSTRLQGLTAEQFLLQAQAITGSCDEATLSMLYLVIRFVDGEEHITPAWSIEIDEPGVLRYIDVHCNRPAAAISVSYSTIASVYDVSRPQSRLA